MKKLRTIICIGAAAVTLAVSANAMAFEHPSWSGVDENGNVLIQVQNTDGTWYKLPSWYEAYAALDYDSAPEDVKEVILIARECVLLEKAGISPYELYSEYLPDLHNPDLGG